MARATEDELIARYLAPLAGPGGLGLQDDAALLTPTPGHDLVLTVDAIVEGVHFLAADPPETLAAKALGVNLSDLAAKGAAPSGFLMVLALPDGWTEEWLAAFCAGLREAAEAAGCPLLGGDTVRAAGPLSMSITALGEVPAGTMVRRTTARPGDIIAVTGTIGDAALGLALLTGGLKFPEKDGSSQPPHAEVAAGGGPRSTQDPGASFEAPGPGPGAPQDEEVGSLRSPSRSERKSPPGLWPAEAAFLIDRYRRPRPRLALAAALRQHASAAMDVSDGLAGDAAKLLRASGVTGAIELDLLPLSPAARAALSADPDLLGRIAGGGDDYEILFTLSPERWGAMRDAAQAAGVAVTAIGEVTDGPEPLSLTRGGAAYALGSPSFQHFGGGQALAFSR
jgi:thiamine-monophosphate kinase